MPARADRWQPEFTSRMRMSLRRQRASAGTCCMLHVTSAGKCCMLHHQQHADVACMLYQLQSAACCILSNMLHVACMLHQLEQRRDTRSGPLGSANSHRVGKCRSWPVGAMHPAQRTSWRRVHSIPALLARSDKSMFSEQTSSACPPARCLTVCVRSCPSSGGNGVE